jgi:hypothetical protein
MKMKKRKMMMSSVSKEIVDEIICIVRKSEKQIKHLEPCEDTTFDADVIKVIKSVAYEEVFSVIKKEIKRRKKKEEE